MTMAIVAGLIVRRGLASKVSVDTVRDASDAARSKGQNAEIHNAINHTIDPNETGSHVNPAIPADMKDQLQPAPAPWHSGTTPKSIPQSALDEQAN
jgi:hypothetical protein